jgi:hypothetical protein
MRRVVAFPLAVLAVVFIVLVGLCATDLVTPAPHLDGSDGCCGFVHCVGLIPGVASVAVGAAAMLAHATVSTPARSASRRPLSPPPELIALRAA